MRVFVYRNLHKQVWSVIALEGQHKGRVVVHAPYVQLYGAIKFNVREAGRQRVIREKRKNVHAGIQGDILLVSDGVYRYDNVQIVNARAIPMEYAAYDPMSEVTYNPYKYSTFVEKVTEAPVTKLDKGFVVLHGNRVFMADFSDL